MMDLSCFPERERGRIASTLDAIPGDAHRGLEIGFYDLRLSRLVAQRLDLVSVDIPHPTDNREGFRLAFADIQRLPFADAAFDIVLCTEVLEHLPDLVLARGVAELRRVARKYLLITVPYRQELEIGLFKCASCGHVCNSQGHVQQFDEDRLLGYFPGARALRTELVGTIFGHAPLWMYRFANRVGRSWHPLIFGETCPGCHGIARIPEANPVGWLTRRVLWRIESRASQRPAWLLVVLAV